VDSMLTRIYREGGIRWRCHSDVYRNSIPPSFVTKFTKGISIHDSGMPALWPISSRVQLQVSRPWPKSMNRSIQISSLSRRGSRVHGGMSWLSSRTLAGLFLLLAYCEHKKPFLLRPGEEPPEDRWCCGPCVFSIVVMVLSMAPFASPFRILKPFLNPVLLSARSNSTVNDTSSKLPSVMVLFSLMLV
jgi:hypothetical protein